MAQNEPQDTGLNPKESKAVEVGLKSQPGITEKNINISTSKTKPKTLTATVTGPRTSGAVNAKIGDKEIVVSTPVNLPHPEEGERIEVTEQLAGDQVIGHQHKPKVEPAK